MNARIRTGMTLVIGMLILGLYSLEQSTSAASSEQQLQDS